VAQGLPDLSDSLNAWHNGERLRESGSQRLRIAATCYEQHGDTDVQLNLNWHEPLRSAASYFQ
jgi:hypothetical protein